MGNFAVGIMQEEPMINSCYPEYKMKEINVCSESISESCTKANFCTVNTST